MSPASVEPGGLLETLEAAAERRSTPMAHGGELAWRCWGAGPPLVLLHGSAGSWRHWARNIPALARAYRVIVPDLPGMGDSGLPPAEATRAGIADVLRQGIHGMLAPDARYALMGFSFGAGLAGLVAGADPRVARLILIAIGGFSAGGPPPPRVKVRALPLPERLLAQRYNLQHLMFHDAGKIDDLAVRIQDINAAAARARMPPRAPDALHQALRDAAAAPCFLWGAEDNFTQARLAEHVALARALRPADARIRVIERTGHWAAYESAEEVNGIVLGWLAEGSAGARW